MSRGRALLVPNPHGIEVAVPTEVELSGDGTPPEQFDYDGNPYRLTGDRGPEGEWVYELRE